MFHQRCPAARSASQALSLAKSFRGYGVMEAVISLPVQQQRLPSYLRLLQSDVQCNSEKADKISDSFILSAAA